MNPKRQSWWYRCRSLWLTLGLVFILNGWFAPAAQAVTQIRLFDLGYRECPPELGAGSVTSGGATMPANCFLITGKAENPSGKPVVDADVFGRIFDANNDSVMQNRSRVGLIEQVPPGVSDFSIRISVPANQPTPLKLEKFKAAGFSDQVRAYSNRSYSEEE